MPKLPKLLKSLTPADAKKAIYVDFEGVGKSPKARTGPRPSLLGVLTNNQYSAYILKEELRPLTKGRKGFSGSGIDQRILEPEIDKAIMDLVLRARDEGRVILYFSDHERSAINEHCSPEASKAFHEVSGNTKLLLQKWKNRRPKQKAEYENTLNDFCRLAGKPGWCPEAVKVGAKSGPAAAIHKLSRECSKTKRWSGLKDADQELARKLFIYNRNDCVVTRKLTIKAVNALSAR